MLSGSGACGQGRDHDDTDRFFHGCKKISHRGIDRCIDGKVSTRRTGSAAANIDDTTLGRLEHWPKQPTHTHTAEKLQRITIYPSLIRQFGEVSRSGSAGRANQYVAAIESILHAIEHVLTAIERAQIRGNGEWYGTARCDHFACRCEIFSRRRHNDRLRAGPGEVGRDFAADATTATSDDRQLLGKLP